MITEFDVRRDGKRMMLAGCTATLHREDQSTGTREVLPLEIVDEQRGIVRLTEDDIPLAEYIAYAEIDNGKAVYRMPIRAPGYYAVDPIHIT